MPDMSQRQNVLSVLGRLGLLEGEEAISPDNPTADLRFSDLEMDSLTVLDFCVALEDQTGHSIEPSDLVQYPSVDALARALEAKAGSRG